MKIRDAFAVMALLCLAGQQVTRAEEHNQLTDVEKKSGWQLLFDGQSTDGWRNYRKEGISDGWVVEEGTLVRGSRGAGDIITADQYGSFELLLEYKISEGGNSGLMFHVQEIDGPVWHTGPEVQILDNAKGKDAQKSGWLYQLYQPPIDPATQEITDATRPAGEWNQIHLRVTPEQCEINMNGVRYARFKKGSPDWDERVSRSKFANLSQFGKADRGHIALQDHGDWIAFRNVKIRELPPDGPLPNPIDGELPLQPVVAFPDLKWDQWEPVDDRGRPQAFRPIVVTYPPDGSNRLFVAEQHGRIFAFENTPDVTDSTLLLDITDKVQYSDRQNEEGLLGLAVHPKFEENGQFFVYYTLKPGLISVISRFTMSKEDPNRADPESEQELLRIEQPFWNHNGGTVTFGPDGYLYVAVGDGGAGNDPFFNAQDLSTPLGSILRIDVDRQEDGKAYAIPEDNPFVGREDALPEIYAYGLRNPWRIEFDRETGELWCADVGQNLWEMIHIITPGGNYGWNYREGTHPFGSRPVPEDVTIIPPIWEYDHGVGKSITGGFVYRGEKLPELRGKYVYADYVTGRLWALSYDREAGRVVSNEGIPSEQMPVITFGEDADGEIYFCIVTPHGRGIYRLERQ
jgi:glucose/arabinose dehydrogenase